MISSVAVLCVHLIVRRSRCGQRPVGGRDCTWQDESAEGNEQQCKDAHEDGEARARHATIKARRTGAVLVRARFNAVLTRFLAASQVPVLRSRAVRRLLAIVLVAVVAALAAATAASAEIVVSRDDQGRAITFDVRTPETDVEWYAGLLRSAAHGDEISTVTIRIVPPEDVPGLCGAFEAAACYGRRAGGATIVVPAGRDDETAHVVLHEYGHHVDQAWRIGGFSEPNGTAAWWAARGMEELLRSGQVAYDYSLGWSRGIGEIFAEDYAYIHLPGRYGIPWLSPPDDALGTALLAELAGSPPAQPVTPVPQPLVVTRRGTLAPRGRRTVPFGLLGPGRRVTVTANVTGASRAGTRARLELTCDGRRIASRAVARGQQTRKLDVRGLGPADCQARLVSTSRSSLTYVIQLRLAIEQPQSRAA